MANTIPPPSNPSFSGVGLETAVSVQGADLVGIDQESAMMSVQGERTRLLDKEIANQIEELRAINRKLELLNEVLSGLKAVQGQFASGDDYDDEWDDKGGGWSYKLADQINRAAMEADINLGFASDDNTWRVYGHMKDFDEYAREHMPPDVQSAFNTWRSTGSLDDDVKVMVYLSQNTPGEHGFLIPDHPGQTINRCPGGIRYDSEYSEVRKAVTKVQGLVDNLSSVQQDQMLRLQAMMNRRNESADMLSNYLRKLDDSRSSIAEKIRGT